MKCQEKDMVKGMEVKEVIRVEAEVGIEPAVAGILKWEGEDNNHAYLHQVRLLCLFCPAELKISSKNGSVGVFYVLKFHKQYTF